MKLIRLTGPAGNPVWVNPDNICVIEEAVGTEIKARTRIVHAGGISYLKEVPEQVVFLCEK